MGTKNNPGKFDCYAAAAPDEPMFILLGRDPLAPELVRQWAARRAIVCGMSDKTQEARRCADDMDGWRLQMDGVQSDPRIVWRGSVSDLATDIAELLTSEQLAELSGEIALKWRGKRRQRFARIEEARRRQDTPLSPDEREVIGIDRTPAADWVPGPDDRKGKS